MGEELAAEAKRLASLSDDELEAEVARRRRERGIAVPAQARPARTLAPSQIAQFTANLELEAGATVEDVEKAYARLRDKYAPYAETTDAKRREAARTLLQSLKKARDALIEHLSR